MKVKVKLGEPLWRQVGNREISLEWKGGTLRELLEELVARYPPLGGELKGKTPVTGGEEEVPYTVFVNGELVPPPKRSEKQVPGGAEVVILLPLAGG